MKKKHLLLVVAICIVPILAIVALVVNTFFYPLTSVEPNFADVEEVYNRMVVPDTWVKTGEGANKGIAGRRCPIESDGCFSKYAEYNSPPDLQKESIRDIVIASGCMSPLEEDKSQKGDERSVFSYTCMSGNIRVIGTWEKDNSNITARITARSR